MVAEITSVGHPAVFDNPGFHQAVRADGVQSVITVSGQIAINQRGQPIHEGDFSAQARVVLLAIKNLMEAAGASLSQIVKLNVYVLDINRRADFAAVREEIFGTKLPPITMVEVSAFTNPDWQIEVDAIAVC